MEKKNNNQPNNNNQLFVEIVGLAGTGKTSLSQALSKQNEQIHIGQDLQLRKIEHFPIFISQIPALLSLYLKSYRLNRRLTWNETKAIVYLNGGEYLINQLISRNGTIILLDQGPIFQLVTLNAFGPDSLKTQGFEHWWKRMYQKWASFLDIVIWLDAPEHVLKERINNREKRHIIKNSNERERSNFLAGYRLAFEQIIDNLRFNGRPKLLRYNTNQVSIEEIVDEVHNSINLILDGNRNISVRRL